MNFLAPSILAADFSNLGDQMKESINAGARYIHFDVMDGLFVPQISFGTPVLQSIRKSVEAVIDVHLMIVDPIRYIDAFADAGADFITFHLEAADDPQAVIDKIHERGIKAGITIKPATPVEDLIPYLDQVEMILIMSVEPGFGGQKFIESSLDKIRHIRALLDERGLSEVDVEVDGGVTLDNIGTITSSGANVIVAGSAVFKGNVAKNTKELLEKM